MKGPGISLICNRHFVFGGKELVESNVRKFAVLCLKAGCKSIFFLLADSSALLGRQLSTINCFHTTFFNALAQFILRLEILRYSDTFLAWVIGDCSMTLWSVFRKKRMLENDEPISVTSFLRSAIVGARTSKVEANSTNRRKDFIVELSNRSSVLSSNGWYSILWEKKYERQEICTVIPCFLASVSKFCLSK